MTAAFEQNTRRKVRFLRSSEVLTRTSLSRNSIYVQLD